MSQELTLLQYDSDPNAVVNPGVTDRFVIPAKLLYIFTGDDNFQAFIEQYEGQQLGHFDTVTKVSWVYQIQYHGQTLAVAQAPLGAPAATMYLETLIDFGAHSIIAVGSCGALTELAENQLLIPTAALRDEGTSFHYLPAADGVTLNAEVVTTMKATLTAAGIDWQAVKTWTTDAFFRETVTKVQSVRTMGCQVVEMECAALAACAAFRQVKFGQLLYTADSLAQLAQHDPRHWGSEGIAATIELAATCLVNVDKN
ncbi:nucleoside phosphorylase [Lactiplantibacillus herbarum]|uniref:nucleoside phosphorylase n=1 Tax=Lactiplantibacillus herbarum TaxID=1670446 RepID=UPI00064EA98C|nr:nucleoside phosphorylase [Lactiplantibacillus herbarum]